MGGSPRGATWVKERHVEEHSWGCRRGALWVRKSLRGQYSFEKGLQEVLHRSGKVVGGCIGQAECVKGAAWVGKAHEGATQVMGTCRVVVAWTRKNAWGPSLPCRQVGGSIGWGR